MAHPLGMYRTEALDAEVEKLRLYFEKGVPVIIAENGGYLVRATSGPLPRPEWTAPPLTADEIELGAIEW